MREKIRNFTALFLTCLTLAGFFSACKQPIDTYVAEQTKIKDADPLDGGGGWEPAKEPYEVLPGTGKLKSKGKAAPGAMTYYVDAENGSDANDGLSPLQPWKSFKNVNATTFNPGDHILLEADSIWNGTPVDLTNRTTLLSSAEVGMLWPKGNGAAGNPIVIDLYDIDGFGTARPTVSWSADKRPLINGNGTPSSNDSYPYAPSGAIYLEDQSYWEIYNMECTNTFANPASEPNHWYSMNVRKGLAGILAAAAPSRKSDSLTLNHIAIRNCYVHDVQSESTNNKPKGSYTLSTYFGGDHEASKIVGGILVNASSYDGIWLEGNIVKKVGLEGLRTSAQNNKNVYIRGNYVETVAGDGIVLSSIDSSTALVENNVIKDSCAAPNTGTANYAACWAYIVKDALFQYNEAYGALYGYQDGEAWDIDSNCDKVIYQYNYSHHNAGGAILFMSAITNGVFRYNISANDGGSTRYMDTVDDRSGAIPVDPSSSSYTAWSNGQTIFHYGGGSGSTGGSSIPLIYNNTFYIGDGITCGLFGNNEGRAMDKYVRFYNNIVVKAGNGTVYLTYGHQGNGNGSGRITNEAGGFKNNLFWGYDTDPAAGNFSKFSHGGTAVSSLFSQYGNRWANPGLRIQQSANVAALRTQRDDAFSAGSFNDPDALVLFTGTAKLRNRASIFSPASASTVTGGMEIPSNGGSPVDGAWAGPRLTADIFGAEINPASPPLGAAAGPYNQ
jgi:hypothetical protein